MQHFIIFTLVAIGSFFVFCSVIGHIFWKIFFQTLGDFYTMNTTIQAKSNAWEQFLQMFVKDLVPLLDHFFYSGFRQSQEGTGPKEILLIFSILIVNAYCI